MKCPWCHEHIAMKRDGTCPACKNDIAGYASEDEIAADGYGEISLEELIADKFRCSKCRGNACGVKEVAVTGSGLAKPLDANHHHYLFVSCLSCGFVEIYDAEVLGESRSIGAVLDVLFYDGGF
ncbi:zinc ribbon domain-containing protein [Paenibacillus thailandensis]|uniref:Zinc ribbon domain-containing protein n=1 Tax=Paenibacillus thailandensis TaxID=393250 RepID=A0ABW5R527_9BACL